MTARALLVVLAAASLACHDRASSDHAAPQASAAVHEHEHGQEAAAPVLDQGRRWKADASTTAAMARMKQLVDAAPPAASQDLPALAALGQALRTEVDGLIAGCTMTGEAHAQLHAFLEPLLQDVGALQSGELEKARAAQESARKRLADYSTYFE